MNEVVTQTSQIAKKHRVKTVDALGRAHAVGKYKRSVARVFIHPGEGSLKINNRDVKEYFKRPLYLNTIAKPFDITNMKGMTGFATVKGGGTTGQMRAVTLGISIALERFNPELYDALRAHKLTTFINKPVERKKPGKTKSRKSKPTSRR